MVTDYTESPDGTVVELAASNLDQPFVEVLQRQNLPSHLQEIILYVIVLADEDQELVTDTRKLLTAKEGFANLALYLASVSRFCGCKAEVFLLTRRLRITGALKQSQGSICIVES